MCGCSKKRRILRERKIKVKKAAAGDIDAAVSLMQETIKESLQKTTEQMFVKFNVNKIYL